MKFGFIKTHFINVLTKWMKGFLDMARYQQKIKTYEKKRGHELGMESYFLILR